MKCPINVRLRPEERSNCGQHFYETRPMGAFISVKKFQSTGKYHKGNAGTMATPTDVLRPASRLVATFFQ